MHVQGRTGAPLSLVEYADYESPGAGRAFGVVERIQLHFGDRLRFEFRHFPLVDAHPRAMPAALLAEAAADADAFWGMHALLLTHQDRLEDGDLAATPSGSACPTRAAGASTTNGCCTTSPRGAAKGSRAARCSS